MTRCRRPVSVAPAIAAGGAVQRQGRAVPRAGVLLSGGLTQLVRWQAGRRHSEAEDVEHAASERLLLAQQHGPALAHTTGVVRRRCGTPTAATTIAVGRRSLATRAPAFARTRHVGSA